MGLCYLLAVGGGVTTGLLAAEPRGQLLIGLIDDPLSRQIVGRYEPLQGRIGLLGIGALTAAALAFCDREPGSARLGTCIWDDTIDGCRTPTSVQDCPT